MATCPNCGYKLKLTDWKPDCPQCKVNLVYYGMEEGLLNDADKAEVEHAHMQKKIDRLKASFVGSPLSIVRLVFTILPLAPLFLTLCSLSYNGPFIEQKTTNVNILTLYNYVSSLNFDSLFAMMKSALLGKGFTFFLVSMITALLSAVLIIVSLISLVAACGPKGNVRSITLSSLMIILAVVSAVTFTKFSNSVHSVFPEFYSGSLGIGAFIYIFFLALLLALNIFIAKKGIPVKYKQTYIGGIPSEEYFELVEKGTDKATLREMMADALFAKEMQEYGEAEAEKAAEIIEEEKEAAQEAAKEIEEAAEDAAEEIEEEIKEELE